MGKFSHPCLLHQKNEITRVSHGVYRGINALSDEDFRFEELVEAMQRVKDGVICLTSALYLYQLTEEMPSQIWIAIKHSIHRATPMTKIVRMRNTILGKTTMQVEGITLSIFDRERTIIDAFRYLGRETALKALKMALTKKEAKN